MAQTNKLCDWEIKRVEGDSYAIHLIRPDGKWCAFMPENGPAQALTFEFFQNVLESAPEVSGEVFGYVMQPAFWEGVRRSTICQDKHGSYQIPVYTAHVAESAEKHVYYKNGDTDAPESIKDRNGDVCLTMCRICGKAEGELTDDHCRPPEVSGEPVVWFVELKDGKQFVYDEGMLKNIDPDLHAKRQPLYIKPQPNRTAQLEARIAELEQESSWIRQKLGVPEGVKLFTAEFAGAIHNIVAHAQGYVKYVESYKCDDKQGEIARQTVQISQLEADKARLVEAIQRNQSALIVLRTICDTSGLKAGQEKAYEMFENNNKLLAEMEVKG